jgi:hypothetical protein
MLSLKKGTNNYEVLTGITLSSLNKRISQITPIFSNLHRMGGRKVTMSSICNLMIILCGLLACILIVDEASTHYNLNKLGTVPP